MAPASVMPSALLLCMLGTARVGLLCPQRSSSVPCSEGCATASLILSESDVVLACSFAVGAVEGVS